MTSNPSYLFYSRRSYLKTLIIIARLSQIDYMQPAHPTHPFPIRKGAWAHKVLVGRQA